MGIDEFSVVEFSTGKNSMGEHSMAKHSVPKLGIGKHSRLALFIAPFLMLGGYIASDVYMTHKVSKSGVYMLKPTGNCDILSKNCILQSGDFKANVYDEAGITTINTTIPLDAAILFLIDEQQTITPYPLAMFENPYYWQRSTALRKLMAETGAKYTLRLIANTKNGQYIAEFNTKHVK